MEVNNRKGFFQPLLWIFIFFIVNELEADLQSEAEVRRCSEINQNQLPNHHG